MNTVRNRQSGVVSLMVTLIMMIVITLIVLGFAEISRNEQRSSLDSQLSVQAYYAAESGINDARSVINAAVKLGAAVPKKTQCANDSNYNLNTTVNSSYGVEYTCVIVDPNPTSLVYNDVGSKSVVIPVISSGSPFSTITINWESATGTTSLVGNCYASGSSPNVFPVASGSNPWNCPYPVLRVDALNANGGFARSSWASDTATFFGVPYNSATGVISGNVDLTARGKAVPASCDGTFCTMNITGLSGTTYYLRINTIYSSSQKLIISAGGQAFSGAQAIIDATGKAQDVIRRVRVAVDLTDANAYNIPSGAIISEDSVCKRYGVTNGSFRIYDDMSSGGGGNALCSVQSVGSPTP